MSQEAPIDQYFNRDDIFFAIAEQYGPLFRNVIFNSYLKGGNPASQFLRSVSELKSGAELDTMLQSRHYFVSGSAAHKIFAIWVKRWFLNVKEIKEFVNALFSLLDWCLEQEGNFDEVLVDVEIGSSIIQSAAELCFRFGDGGDERIDSILAEFATQCKRTHVQDVIRNMWAKDLYPNWATPTELYMESHGQFLQSVFSTEGGLVSNIYRTICATERLVKHGAGIHSDLETGIRGPFSESLASTLQITEPLLKPQNVTRYYDIKEGDGALPHFVNLLFYPTTAETRPLKLRFKYTLYLAGYSDYFYLNLNLLSSDFPGSDFGRSVDFPAYWKTHPGSSHNRVPLETWKELLKITTEAIPATDRVIRGQSLPRIVRLAPTLNQRPRPQTESAPAVINITRNKKRRRSPLTSENEEKLAEAPDAKRTRGGGSSPSQFEEPGATTTENKNQYVVVLAAIGVLTLGAVVYTKGRA